MFSAADLVQAVQRRLRLTQRRSHPPGEFPPGWETWFAQMRERVDAVTGASADSILAVLLARPPAAALPQPIATMNRWQVFASVWRQHWQPPEPQERGLRWGAGILSALIHVLLGMALLWLLFAAPRSADAPPEGETVVQVEYIGRGTPEEVGGGPAPESEVEPEPVETPAAAQASQPAPSQPVPSQPAPSEPEQASQQASPAAAVPQIDTAIETPALQTAPPPVASRDVPLPEQSAAETPPAAEQRLTVSEPAPDTSATFVLPPPTPRLQSRPAPAPELEAAQPVVRTREIPAPAQAPSRPSLEIRTPAATEAPAVQASLPGVAERDVPAPVRRPRLQAPATATIAAPELASRSEAVREASVPMPAAASTAPASTAAASDAPATAPATRPSAGPAAPADGTPSRATAGSGPRSEPAPGGWPTPERADDWGASDRNVPGGQRGEGPGLYNSDGSVRLADTPGSASPARPPGAFTEEITDLDRNGTWLKRAPVGYEPTLFDRYWRPNETLLQEWVRRGIKSVEIPIPGTTKKISCAVSLLALGGACGISDPNLNEQPAEARPPPDIPFKPELQEGNGSLRPTDGG